MVRRLRLHGLRALLRRLLLSEGGPRGAATLGRHAVCRRLPDAADRQSHLRLSRGPPRPPDVADRFDPPDVLRLAPRRRITHLCDDRGLGARDPVGRPYPAGAEPGWGIRHERHLPQRDRRTATPRLLLRRLVRHADRRATLRRPAALHPAEAVPHAGPVEGLGMAHPFRDRRPHVALWSAHARAPA